MAEKPRLCEVKGRTAIFHRWVDKSNRILHLSSNLLNPKFYNQIIEDYNTYGLVAGGCKVDILTETFALVEYDDGSVEYVEPTDVKFIFFDPAVNRAMELKNKRKTTGFWRMLMDLMEAEDE